MNLIEVLQPLNQLKEKNDALLCWLEIQSDGSGAIKWMPYETEKTFGDKGEELITEIEEEVVQFENLKGLIEYLEKFK